jgi:hypothetical protein
MEIIFRDMEPCVVCYKRSKILHGITLLKTVIFRMKLIVISARIRDSQRRELKSLGRLDNSRIQRITL